MSWNITTLADAHSQPWKNGGGITRELLAWPSATDWRVRISVADIHSDGPFSLFEGVQRWFAVLSGSGVVLKMNGSQHTLNQASDAFAFDGNSATHCRLVDGPTQDLNLMLRGARGHMLRVQGEHSANLACQEQISKMIAVYAANTEAVVQIEDESLDLPRQTLCWMHWSSAQQRKPQPAPLRVRSSNALWMEVTL